MPVLFFPFQLVDEGLVRSIGVSNFSISQLENLIDKARIKPVVNQIEVRAVLNARFFFFVLLSRNLWELQGRGRDFLFNALLDIYTGEIERQDVFLLRRPVLFG